MRSKNNLKQFGHTAKSRTQRSSYESLIQGKQKRGGTTGDRPRSDFSGTDSVKGKIVKGKNLPPSKPPKPYVSSVTWVKEHWLGILSSIFTLILLPFGIWVVVSLNAHSTDIAVQENRLGTVEGDIEALEKTVGGINDRSIQSEAAIENILQYLFRVMGVKVQDEDHEE